MKNPIAFALAAVLTSAVLLPVARPAQADTTSTIILAAAAGAIIGSLFTDTNNQPYYVSNGRHVYVSQNTANYYRAHGNTRNQGPQRDGGRDGDRQRDNHR
jgi:hypothetical protein